MKISTKISLSFLVTAIVLTSIITLITTPINKRNMQKAIFFHLETAAQSRAHHIETFLEEKKVLAENIALIGKIEKLLLTSNTDLGYNNQLIDVKERLKRSIDAGGHIKGISIMDKSGIIITSTIDFLIGMDRSKEAAFLEGMKKTYVHGVVFPLEGTKKPVLFVSTPVIKDNEVLGVVVIRINAEELFEIATDRMGLRETGEIYLINKDSLMITPSRFLLEEDILLKQKIDTVNSRDCLSTDESSEKHIGHEAIGVFRDYRGVKVVGTHAYISEMGWCLLAEIDEKEALESLNVLLNIAIGVVVITPLAAWFIGRIIAKTITKQINLLSQGVELVGKGDLSHKIIIESKDEIGNVAWAFNKMTGDLKQAQSKIQGYSKGLEMKVEERTRQLEKKIEESDRSKLAVLNILEDVDKARKDLDKAYSELQTIEIKKGEFLNIAAHELKTPLQPIIGYTDRLLNTDSVNEWGKKRLNIVLENANHLKQLIQDVLDINKMETGIMKFTMEDIDIVQIVKEAYESFKPTVEEKDLKYVLDVAQGQGQVKVRGDVNRLNQVFGNLLGNAIKFTDKGSITVKLVEDKNSATISIIDTGMGIKKPDVKKLFTKFFQADGSIKRNFGGTGLGLAISKEIVKAHKGEISAKSVFGKGSEFIVILPKKKA